MLWLKQPATLSCLDCKLFSAFLNLAVGQALEIDGRMLFIRDAISDDAKIERGTFSVGHRHHADRTASGLRREPFIGLAWGDLVAVVNG